MGFGRVSLIDLLSNEDLYKGFMSLMILHIGGSNPI